MGVHTRAMQIMKEHNLNPASSSQTAGNPALIPTLNTVLKDTLGKEAYTRVYAVLQAAFDASPGSGVTKLALGNITASSLLPLMKKTIEEWDRPRKIEELNEKHEALGKELAELKR